MTLYSFTPTLSTSLLPSSSSLFFKRFTSILNLFGRFTGNVTKKATVLSSPSKISIPNRNSMLHGGTLTKQPTNSTQHTDTSGFHKIVFRTECKEKACPQQICTDPKTDGSCPLGSAIQNQTQIPTTDPTNGVKTTIIGNATGKVPSNKPGFCINSTKNYAKKSKKQEMVMEKPPVDVDSKDIVVDNQSSTFLQEPQHTQLINTKLP